MRWEKPPTPFDLQKFINGDHSWIGKRGGRLANGYLTPQTTLDHVSTSSSREPHRPEPEPRPEARSGAEIVDIDFDVPLQRKRFKVPEAPSGIQFFRLTTKRLIRAGEELSESDDDIDEEWLQNQHSDVINALPGLWMTEKEFLRRFDRHFLLEDPASRVYKAESIVRFCRQNRNFLQAPAMRVQLFKKLDALRIQNRLTMCTYRECLKIISESPNKQQSSEEAISVDGLVLNDRSNERPASPKEHFFDRCAGCSEIINDLRELRFCTHPGCENKTWHRQFSCSGPEREGEDPKSFRCPVCRAALAKRQSNQSDSPRDRPTSGRAESGLKSARKSGTSRPGGTAHTGEVPRAKEVGHRERRKAEEGIDVEMEGVVEETRPAVDVAKTRSPGFSRGLGGFGTPIGAKLFASPRAPASDPLLFPSLKRIDPFRRPKEASS